MIISFMDVVELYAHIGLLQIGCTDHATYFRADGKMYGCGLDIGNDKPAYEPTLINTKGHV